LCGESYEQNIPRCAVLMAFILQTFQEDPMSIQGVITGYTLYVNGKLWEIYETQEQAYKEASRYRRFNDIDIYPMWKFN
jgi:hypothetical protein